jgi:hypothetical protein
MEQRVHGFQRLGTLDQAQERVEEAEIQEEAEAEVEVEVEVEAQAEKLRQRVCVYDSFALRYLLHRLHLKHAP